MCNCFQIQAQAAFNPTCTIACHQITITARHADSLTLSAKQSERIAVSTKSASMPKWALTPSSSALTFTAIPACDCIHDAWNDEEGWDDQIGWTD